MVLTDLSHLGAVKESFVKNASQGNRQMTGGLYRGQQVRLMDSNETAVIIGRTDNNTYQLDVDGVIIPVRRDQFFPIDYTDESRLYFSVTSTTKNHDVVRSDTRNPREEQCVDLHLVKIPGHEYIRANMSRDFQMDYFRSILRENLKHRGKSIVFIHGKGEGVLAEAIHRELNTTFARSCRYTMENEGATRVTIR